MDLDFSLRKITIEDAQLLFSWRNDPRIYKYLFNPVPVDWENHIKWLEGQLIKTDVLFLMALYQQKDCGTVRYDFNSSGDEVEIGIYLAPEFHGKKLSSPMLLASENYLRYHFPRVKKIIAKVLIENQASLKMFEKSDYKKDYIQLHKDL